jgi:hypothetical protein
MRTIGVDYSGAGTATESLPGLQAYVATGAGDPVRWVPPPSARKHWTRRGLAEQLAGWLADGEPTFVGIDHGFSFPEAYFDRHGIPKVWDAFLDDFCAHWPTGKDLTPVSFVREGACGRGAERLGHSRWRRLTEVRAGGAKSVFHFDVQGQVATSTHAGLPWLRYRRGSLGSRLHFWPFDGWVPPAGASVIAEAFPSLWRMNYPTEGRTAHEHDAYVVCRWLQEGRLVGDLQRFLQPALTNAQRVIAGFEGWILGVA